MKQTKKKTLDRGVYQLLIFFPRERKIKVGRLGHHPFPRGYYLYTGSAQNGLEARISRHLSSSSGKTLYWHIDYLLRFGRVVKTMRYPGMSKEGECFLNHLVSEDGLAIVMVPRFGASDCHCPTHLYFFEDEPITLWKSLGPEKVQFMAQPVE